MRQLLSLAVASIILVGCDGDDKKNEGNTTSSSSSVISSNSSSSVSSNSSNVDYSKLKLSPSSNSELELASADTLAERLKNGLRLQVGNNYRYSGDVPQPIFARATTLELDTTNGEVSAPPSTDSADRDGNYSDTNVHVDGVDEADYVKYDGKHWFVSTYPYLDPFLINRSPGIQIVATDPANANAEIVAEIDLGDEFAGVQDMYLVGSSEQASSHLAVVQKRIGNVYPVLPGFPSIELVDFAVTDEAILPYPVNSEISIQLFDVSDASQPKADKRITIDGSLVDSRKIGNVLYLVTRYDPWLEDIHLNYYSDAAAHDLDNETTIANASLHQLMPYIQIGDSRQLLTDNCYLQDKDEANYGYGSLIHLSAIDLETQSLVSSQCLSSNVSTISMSEQALYLTGEFYGTSWREQGTVIHKFDLNLGQLNYAASGEVAGSLGWNSDPAFRLHEYQGDLRVVSTDRSTGTPIHLLSILEQSEGKLKTVAQLPNAAKPAPIGKPNEDIYSVRFNADKAYIVTFERSDPLYAIDLSDRLNPQISGELEIPGFATYMHPLNDNYLFTLGYDATEQGRILGIKAELIDVSAAAPKVVTTLKFGDVGSHSAALNDLKALSFLEVSVDEVRVAFPVTLYLAIEEELRSNQGKNEGLQLIELKGLSTGKAVMQNAGMIATESEDLYAYERIGLHRGILHDDAVFYTHNNAIWAARWEEPELAKGPITGPPNTCTEQYVYGLNVTVHTPEGYNACDAQLTASYGNYFDQLMPLDSSEPGQSCSFYGAGEQAGRFRIESKLPGLISAARYQSVYRDKCHVIPESVDLYMSDDVVCTTLAYPALNLSLELFANENGDLPQVDACSAQVRATQIESGKEFLLDAYPAEDTDPLSEKGCYFFGAHEMKGQFHVSVELEGFVPYESDDFNVERGQCHVIPIEATIELIAEP